MFCFSVSFQHQQMFKSCDSKRADRKLSRADRKFTSSQGDDRRVSYRIAFSARAHTAVSKHTT